jgi:DNA polymerase (family 10)
VREPEPARDAVPIELRDRVLAGDLDADDAPRDLLTESDFRGDLHTHSDWSDGKAKLLDMARAARNRGDQYICVTDHSAPYAMVGGLDAARLQAQAEEIAAANEQLAAEHDDFLAELPEGLDLARVGDTPFRVLRGTELEILADGTLGLPDDVLERLDWVVASIHVSQRQSEAEIVARMRRAVESPFVDAIGHPTSRRVLTRARTALPIDVLVELAVEHGLVLEINANPDRLDLDSDHAAAALAAGVQLTVNTDAHRTRTLGLRSHGVAVARRAGARAVDVVNCLDVDTLLTGRRRHASA